MDLSIKVHNNIVSGPEEEYIPAHLSYGQFIFDQFKKGGNNVALISSETGATITYNEILQYSVNLAVALKGIGLRVGDVVALSSENRFEFIITTLAVSFNGAVLAPINITYAPGEIVHLLNITKPKYVFSSPITAQNIYDCCKDLPFVEKYILFGEYEIIPAIMYDTLVKAHANVDDFVIEDVGGSDTIAVMCSSGTTGLPKGVMLTHINFLALSRHMRYYLQTSYKAKGHTVKVYLALVPWFHAYGFITTLAVMSMNIEIVFLVRFEEQQFLETIQKYKVNMMTIVPPIATFLAKHPLVSKYDLSSINEVWCGSSTMSSELQKAASKRIGLPFLKQGYGLTELTMACCVDIAGAKYGSCGTPAPGMKIKVLDVETGQMLGPGHAGELWIKSSLRMKGYLGDSAASDALVDDAGYVRTGDIGYYDQDGYFFIIDRLKELIKYNGFQVPPAELEALLLQHPAVAECGVVGKPDPVAGELPTAFVVPQIGTTPTAEDLVQFITSKVSPAKRLRGGVIFIKEIPKNASGKILRRELKKLLPNASSKL